VAGDTVVFARVVILACGASYAFQRRFGLGLPRSYLHTAQRELPVHALGDVEVHFGSEVARGGFAWAVPAQRLDGPCVRIGAMATHAADQCYARMCERIADRWGLSGDVGSPRLKILPLGPIDRTFSDRLLVIGDAAGLVKPTTGGGIYYSIVSGSLAAGVASQALARNRLEGRSALAIVVNLQQLERDFMTGEESISLGRGASVGVLEPSGVALEVGEYILGHELVGMSSGFRSCPLV